MQHITTPASHPSLSQLLRVFLLFEQNCVCPVECSVYCICPHGRISSCVHKHAVIALPMQLVLPVQMSPALICGVWEYLQNRESLWTPLACNSNEQHGYQLSLALIGCSSVLKDCCLTDHCILHSGMSTHLNLVSTAESLSSCTAGYLRDCCTGSRTSSSLPVTSRVHVCTTSAMRTCHTPRHSHETKSC